MKNLAQKVLNALKNIKNLDTVQKDIEKYQSNLMKNINSKLLDNNEKNKLLTVYTNLHDIGKSLYKYDVLNKNNKLAVAEEEKEEIKHKVLKGYISNVKYVWRSEHGEHTCEECESMDGEEFESYEDIPPQPHPNCKCYIEVYECPYEPEDFSDEEDNDDEKPQPKKPQEEPCDCWKLTDAIEKLIEYAENLKSRLENEWQEVESAIIVAINSLPYEYEKTMSNISESIMMKWKDADNVFGDILSNMYELRQDVGNADKYYHAKTHCEIAQRESEIQTAIGDFLAQIKEVGDFAGNIIQKGWSIEEAIRDRNEDLKANKTGKELGRQYPNESCEVLLDDIYLHTKKDSE